MQTLNPGLQYSRVRSRAKSFLTPANQATRMCAAACDVSTRLRVPLGYQMLFEQVHIMSCTMPSSALASLSACPSAVVLFLCMQGVSPERAAELQSQGWTIADVRVAADFEKQHAQGAISLPMYRYVQGTGFWVSNKPATSLRVTAYVCNYTCCGTLPQPAAADSCS